MRISLVSNPTEKFSEMALYGTVSTQPFFFDLKAKFSLA